jgi:F-type H+-transporting ATPase subunit epsilon
MAFQCVVVTPEQQLLDESIIQAIVPGHDGLIGILTDRAPLLMKVGIGPLRIDRPGGARSYFFVDGGVAQMKANRLTILTNHATPASEIDAEAARAEYAEAAARRATDTKSALDRESQMARARAKQDVAVRK